MGRIVVGLLGQIPCRPSKNMVGRYRIRTCDFHRVNLDRLGFSTTYKCVEAA